MSTFVTHLHHELVTKIQLPSTVSPTTPGSVTQSSEALRSYFLELDPPTSLDASRAGLQKVRRLQEEEVFVQAADSEEEALQIAIAAKLTVGIYTQFLELYLNEASDAEAELEWWSDVERSRWRTAYFLLQSEWIPHALDPSYTLIVTLVGVY